MKRIEIYCGTIDTAFEKLKTSKEEAYCEFNGHTLASDMTLDEMYLTITGYTKAEFDRRVDERQKEYEREEQRHKDNIPRLTEEYRSKGKSIIPEDKLELWDKIVPIRLGDLYHGMELDCWLTLIPILNDESKSKEKRFEECKAEFDKQGHSGMSGSLVLAGLREFCPLGNEFTTFMR